jgi:biopolymer transport protein ExbD
MFCEYCGKQTEENTKFCGSCGKPVVANIPLPPEIPDILSSNDFRSHLEGQRPGPLPIAVESAKSLENPRKSDLHVKPNQRYRQRLIIGTSLVLIFGLAIVAASIYLLRLRSLPADSPSTVSTTVTTVLPHTDPPPGRPPMRPEVIDLQIDFDGTLLWNTTAVDRQTLQRHISEQAGKHPLPEVHFAVDKFVRYGIVAQTLADLQHRGLRGIIEQVQMDPPNTANVPTQMNPEDITIAIDKDGNVYWNAELLANHDDLLTHLRAIARHDRQPEVRIRGDADVRYDFVGQVLVATKTIGISKVRVITQPDPFLYGNLGKSQSVND